MKAAGIVTKPARALVLASGLLAATSIIGFAQDVTVNLGTAANYPMTNAYLNPPSGTVTLGGHVFDMTSGNMILLKPGQSVTLSGNYPNASAVYLLINSFNTYSAKAIGRVVLTFSDGTSQTTTLVAGLNIREWSPIPNITINTMGTDPANLWSLTNVWPLPGQPTNGGIIDMLTINPTPLTTSPRVTYRTITSISIISDTAGDGQWATGMIVPAITVNDGPICYRPGHSIKACGHSEADEHSESKNFTSSPTAPGQLARIDGKRANENTED